MTPKRLTRHEPNPRALTAGTGDDIYGPDDSIASDSGFASSQGATAGPVVGRTPYDLLHEQGLSAAAGTLVRSMDAVELLATLAYVLFGLFMKGNGLVMRFWVFCGLLAGYHWVVKPVGRLFARWMDRKVPPPPVTQL